MKNSVQSNSERYGRIFWFTGRPASGKTTICCLFSKWLCENGWKICILDGDEIRSHLNKDLGFTKEDRMENVRRISEVACLFSKEGITPLVCTISPFEDIRRMSRNICQNYYYTEIYVKAKLETCIKRDYKSIYNGEHIFADYYEENTMADIVVNTEQLNPNECIQKILKEIGWSKR